MTHPHPIAEKMQSACRFIPGGVNSPVRAFHAVGGDPVFVARGQGSRIYADDGRAFIDYCGSWGPLILGHADPEVVEAVQRTAADGLTFGACTSREVELATLLCAQVSGLERVRLVNSGTEACMTAIRLARAFTGRSKILKFDGAYHGHADPFLVAAGSGLLTGGIAASAGVTAGVAFDTLVARYNDLASVDALILDQGADLAAVIVEPVAGNMGLVPPAAGFLEGLRERTRAAGALLIFDEVITGFRLGPTTVGNLFGIQPDLTCLGKIIGGGMPIGAVGGQAAIMDQLAPLGAVYQAGTLSGNPVAVAAGLATLQRLCREPPYAVLSRHGQRIAAAVEQRAPRADSPLYCQQLGGMFTLFFGSGPIHNLDDVKRCDSRRYAHCFHQLLARGVYFPPSPFEVCFISAAHTDADIQCLIDALPC